MLQQFPAIVDGRHPARPDLRHRGAWASASSSASWASSTSRTAPSSCSARSSPSSCSGAWALTRSSRSSSRFRSSSSSARWSIALLITRVERAPQTQGLVAMFGLMVLIENLGTIAWTTDTRVITAPYTNTSLVIGGVTLVHVKLIAGLLALLLIAGLLGVPALHPRRPGHSRDGSEPRSGDRGRRQRRAALRRSCSGSASPARARPASRSR